MTEKGVFQVDKKVIGVDIGGTNLRFGIVKRSGLILHRLIRPTMAQLGRETVIKNIIDGIEELIAVSNIKKKSILGIGLGTPGFIDSKGIITFSPNLPGWQNVDLKKIIRSRIKIPVIIENDANAAAFGERWLGAGRSSQNLLCITLGTGIGGGIILNNKIWHGDKGMAGEIGHITVNPDGPLCNCGNYGCLEAYSSATGMINRIKDLAERGRETSLLPKIKSGIELNAREIFLEAKKGDLLALEVIEDAGKYLGIAISGFANLLNIKTVIIYGGLASGLGLFANKMKEEIRKRVIPSFSGDVRVLKAKLKDDAGMIGAAGVVLHSKGLLRFK
ncbi:MAG: ROK family protein [Nitrospirota bacterium]